MIEPDHPDLSISMQCRLLSISRSSFYYSPLGETDTNLGLMRVIDKQFLDTPFYGVRQMTRHLRNEGHPVNERHIRRLMRLMGLMPIYQGPNTSKPAKGHRTYRYLLQGAASGSAGSSLVRRHHPCVGKTVHWTVFFSSSPGCGAGSSIWSPSWTGLGLPDRGALVRL
jgi:transposase InsO family protein